MSTELDITYTPATTLAEADADLAQVLEIARLALAEAKHRNHEATAPADRAARLRNLERHLVSAIHHANILPTYQPAE